MREKYGIVPTGLLPPTCVGKTFGEGPKSFFCKGSPQQRRERSLLPSAFFDLLTEAPHRLAGISSLLYLIGLPQPSREGYEIEKVDGGFLGSPPLVLGRCSP